MSFRSLKKRSFAVPFRFKRDDLGVLPPFGELHFNQYEFLHVKRPMGLDGKVGMETWIIHTLITSEEEGHGLSILDENGIPVSRADIMQTGSERHSV